MTVATASAPSSEEAAHDPRERPSRASVHPQLGSDGAGRACCARSGWIDGGTVREHPRRICAWGRRSTCPSRSASSTSSGGTSTGSSPRTARATSCLNFRGAGCWQHYVPAVCDEINSRGEFLTAYGGLWYSDHGKIQAYFEYQSMMGELLDMDAVSLTTYDWSSHGALHGMLMASRLTDRTEVLVPRSLSRPKRSPAAQLRPHRGDHHAGGLRSRPPDRSTWSTCGPSSPPASAAVYVENPLPGRPRDAGGRDRGGWRTRPAPSASWRRRPHLAWALLEPPGSYGADIACGDVQPLGIHMQYGGGTGGFLASRHDPRYLEEYPTLLTTITRTADGDRPGLRVVELGSRRPGSSASSPGTSPAPPPASGPSPRASIWR